MSAIVGLLGHAGSGKDTVADYLVKNYGFVKMSLADEMKRFVRKVFGFSDHQMWGASQYRNDVDSNYADPDRWDLAEDNLMSYGRDWAKCLFSSNRAKESYYKLLTWFDGLRLDYSIEFGGENKLTPRVVLQTIGTEYGRVIDDNVWINSTITIAQTVLAGESCYTREFGCSPLPLSTSPAPRPGVVIPDCRFRNEVDGVQGVGGRIVRIVRAVGSKQVGITGHASEAEQDSIPDIACDHVLLTPEGLNNLNFFLAHSLPPIIGGLK